MADLNKWTVAEFKRTEQDLLEKRKRRKEIPVTIANKEREIQQLKQNIVKNENTISTLEKNDRILTYEIDQLEINYRQTMSYTGGDYKKAIEWQRNQIQSSINDKEKQQRDNSVRLSGLKSEIAKEYEKIRRLELEISNLKAEDQKIIEKCREYITTFQDVKNSAEKAAQTHQRVENAFGYVASATRFGKNVNQNGQNITKKIEKQFMDQVILAQDLALLAHAIIESKDVDTSSALAGTGDSNPSAGGNVQDQDVMNMGCCNSQEGLQNSSRTSGVFPQNPDGSTDFESVSFVPTGKIDGSITSYDLDEYWGGKRFGISVDQMKQFRRESGVVWHVEGDNVYLIHKEHDAYASPLGYDLDEWNEEKTSSGKTKILKK